jgi:hypothetical protein
MVISGLWHGTSWHFLVWGALNGVYLVINQLWRALYPQLHTDQRSYQRIMKPVGLVLTLLCGFVAVVFFRAPSVDSALSILRGAAGFYGLLPSEWTLLSNLGVEAQLLRLLFHPIKDFAWIIALMLVVTLLPNSMEVLRPFRPALYFHAGVAKPLMSQSPSTFCGQRSTGREGISIHRRSCVWGAIRFIQQFAQEGIRLNRLTAILIALICALGMLALGDGDSFIYARY